MRLPIRPIKTAAAADINIADVIMLSTIHLVNVILSRDHFHALAACQTHLRESCEDLNSLLEPVATLTAHEVMEHNFIHQPIMATYAIRENFSRERSVNLRPPQQVVIFHVHRISSRNKREQ